jgi:hypothetical protein
MTKMEIIIYSYLKKYITNNVIVKLSKLKPNLKFFKDEIEVTSIIIKKD